MLHWEFFYVHFGAFLCPEENNLYGLSITVNSAMHRAIFLFQEQ